MERKLFKIITLPASIAALIFGFWMIYLNPSLMKHGWMHAKLFFALALFGMTHMCGGIMRKLHNDTYQKSEKYLRVLNEVPTILMIIIVFLVILKPF
jgi:putative membrane protein